MILQGQCCLVLFKILFHIQRFNIIFKISPGSISCKKCDWTKGNQMTKDTRFLSLLWLHCSEWQLMTALQMPAAHLPLSVLIPQAVVHGEMWHLPVTATHSVLPSLQGTGKKPVLLLKKATMQPNPKKYHSKISHFQHSAEVCKQWCAEDGHILFSTLLSSCSLIAPPQESRNHPRMITLKWASCDLKKDLWRVVKYWFPGCPDWWWMPHPRKH